MQRENKDKRKLDSHMAACRLLWDPKGSHPVNGVTPGASFNFKTYIFQSCTDASSMNATSYLVCPCPKSGSIFQVGFFLTF